MAWQGGTSRLFERATDLSYTLLDDVHSILDEAPFMATTPSGTRRLETWVKRMCEAGIIGFGALVSALGKLGRCASSSCWGVLNKHMMDSHQEKWTLRRISNMHWHQDVFIHLVQKKRTVD
jgi:hypothetical protein